MPKVTQPPGGQSEVRVQGQAALGARVTLNKPLPSSVKNTEPKPCLLPAQALRKALQARKQWVKLGAG